MGDAPGTSETRNPRRIVAERGGRIDAVVAEACPDLSRARVQRLIAAGAVQLNGGVVRKSGQVAPGDELRVEIPATEHEAPPSGLSVPILFEDAAMAAIDKPAGVAVHGAPGDTGPSVAAWWVERLGESAAGFDVERPGIVHRLDKDTSGVLLLAKTPRAQAALSAGFEARETAKTYLAVVDGVPERSRAVIEAPIARHPGDRTKMAVARRGRDARTAYEVLGYDGERALLLVRPETGRTHQIRVHLASISVPVTHDRVYGRAGVGRQLLHAWQIRVPHPAGGTLTVTAPLPGDFRDAVRLMGVERLALPYTIPIPPERVEATQ